MAALNFRRIYKVLAAGLVQALCMGCAAGVGSVLPDIDHVPGYLWLLWPDTFANIDPRWFGRPLHVHFLVLGFVVCCVCGALFVGFSLAAYVLRRREAE